MSDILCTFPGRYGDILWALPTVRAISEKFGRPVDFACAGKYGSITELVGKQPYIAQAGCLPRWEVEESAPMRPRVPPTGGWENTEHVFHLGYDRWPANPLPIETWYTACQQLPDVSGMRMNLTRPWITEPAVPLQNVGTTVMVGWSEEWIELKMGLTLALAARFPKVQFHLLFATNQRHKEWLGVLPNNVGYRGTLSWPLMSACIREAHLFLGCLSALWVLATACGVPTIAAEPNPNRHHPIFWPAVPGHELVHGNDGKPTFDARHVGDAIERKLVELGRV